MDSYAKRVIRTKVFYPYRSPQTEFRFFHCNNKILHPGSTAVIPRFIFQPYFLKNSPICVMYNAVKTNHKQICNS